jgi:RNA polymerase sigma-70 factor (ECF subfamily)
MGRVCAGDIDAFEQLYDRYHRLVYGIAVKMLQTDAAAEDLTQGVFLKLWTAASTYRHSNFAGWIVRVTRNLAIDVLRADVHHVELPVHIPIDAPGVDDSVATQIDAAQARAVIAGLPEEQRAVIELAFFRGLTHTEIAVRTGMPLGTVKTRIRAGLRAVRAAMTRGVPA